MVRVTTSIGNRFEEIFTDNFKDFEKNSSNPNYPDFHNGQFHVETKCGNREWGCRIKGYQIESFTQLDLPTLYFIGYHDFYKAHETLLHLSEKRRQDILRKKMNVLSGYFVSDSVIRKIWEKESRFNAKGTMLYCMLKENMLSRLIDRKKIKRQSQEYDPHEFYDLETNRLILRSLSESHLDFPLAFILDIEDRELMKHLKNSGN